MRLGLKLLVMKRVTLEDKKINILVYLEKSAIIHLLYVMLYFVPKYIFEYLISEY